MQQREDLGGDLGIVEGQRSRARLAQEVGLGGHVVYPELARGTQVDRDHGTERDAERDQRRQQHHADQLRADRSGPAHAIELAAHDGSGCTTRATASRRALIFSPARLIEWSATSKRTLSSTTTKLMALPSASAPSDSDTTSTGTPSPEAASAFRRGASPRPTNNTCSPRGESPRPSRRTRTAWPFTCRPATICSSSWPSVAPPSTPMVNGAAARSTVAGGQSMKPTNLKRKAALMRYSAMVVSLSARAQELPTSNARATARPQQAPPSRPVRMARPLPAGLRPARPPRTDPGPAAPKGSA